MNFLPVEKKKKEKKYKIAIGIIAFFILLTGFISFSNYLHLRTKQTSLNQEQLKELEPFVNTINQLEGEIRIVEEQLKVYKDILDNKYSYIPWLYELSTKLPPDVKIDNLNFKGENMVLLDGSAQSAVKVMEALEESELFSKLEFIGGIGIDDGRERFRIVGDLIND